MKKTIVLIILLATTLVCAPWAYSDDLTGDLDGDGDVDAADLAIFSDNYGKSGDTCTENDQCGRASYCAKDQGNCDGAGKCVKRPQACPEIYEPVCGCDSITYPNACHAASAGVNVAGQEPCAESGFELGEAFKLRVAETKKNADENISIKFVEVPSDSRCPKEVRCIWAGNAQAVFTFQKADASQSFILNTTIEPKEQSIFGYKIQLVTLQPPASIRNSPRPEDYIASVIITKDDTSCSDDSNCAKGSFCKKQIGDCDGNGICHPIPGPDIACPEVWKPVCGCDGKTYSNACFAKGVNIAKIGKCPESQCDDGTDATCKMMPPKCEEPQILAVQNNCWVCVDAETCEP